MGKQIARFPNEIVSKKGTSDTQDNIDGSKSERSQIQKTTHYMTLIYEIREKTKPKEINSCQ